MKWKDPKIELPNGCSIRCLAYCKLEMTSESFWEGYLDVYYHPSIGWRRCENQNPVWVEKWVDIEDIKEQEI